jgi:hypothetical protein
VSPQVQKQYTVRQPWTETSESVSQNKIFLFLNCFLSVILCQEQQQQQNNIPSKDIQNVASDTVLEHVTGRKWLSTVVRYGLRRMQLEIMLGSMKTEEFTRD